MAAPPKEVLSPELEARIAQLVTESDDELEPLSPDEWPRVEDLVTEDDAPVDNLFSETQQRLLTEPLYAVWRGGAARHKFIAMANVGLFVSVAERPTVPDVLVSLNGEAPSDLWAKHHRSYFIWEYGKPPDVVIEIVSNTEGGETDEKLQKYARLGVTYYVIFDPLKQAQPEPLRIYSLRDGRYVRMRERWLPQVGLGLTLWEGAYEDKQDVWLRWCDQDGNLVATGAEQSEIERQRAEQERQRAEQERQRAERLAAQLRALGVELKDS
jgi:Uma2 family endonuclease